MYIYSWSPFRESAGLYLGTGGFVAEGVAMPTNYNNDSKFHYNNGPIDSPPDPWYNTLTAKYYAGEKQ
jgi:hypothetical protein